MATPERIFIYIDGESHYIRTESAWAELHGEDASLEQLRQKGDSANESVLLVPQATVFWTRRMGAGATRSIYFTSVARSNPEVHAVKLAMRSFDLDAHMVVEKKQAAERRQNKRRDSQLIEKPKGVDITLAVQMLEHTRVGAFDRCHLYTSDADFLPAIQAVRAQGKQVWVFGYKDALPKESELLTVPDQFIDLSEMLKSDCELVGTDIARGQV